MIRSRGSGFATLSEREEIDDAFSSKFTASTSNSRAKRVERKPEHKRWYEREEIASQYLYCVKEPPCQTCCRYNEKLFKTLLEQKIKFPSYKRKMIGNIHLRPRIYQGRLDEGAMKHGSNLSLCYHGLQSSDVIASTSPVHVPPVHPFYPDVKDASPPRFCREPCNVTKSSEPACSCNSTPSRDFYYGVKDTVVTNTRKFPPARPDDAEKGREFFRKPQNGVTNCNLLPTRILGAISLYDAVPIERSIHCPCRDNDPLLRHASGKLLRPVSCNAGCPPRSQSTSSTKIQPRFAGEANWRKGEVKEFFCRQSPPSKLCTKRNIGNRYEPKLQAESSLDRPFDSPNTILYSLSRIPEGNSCKDSAQSLLKRPALSPCDDRTFSARFSSEKLPDPPPIGNPSAAKPPRPPSRAQTISSILPPSAPGRPRDTEPLKQRIICKDPPCKPCNISCFDQNYSPNRAHDFYTSYDKPCTLPDISARRNNLNLCPRPHDNTRRAPFWKVAPNRSSPWRSASSQTSSGRLRGTAYNKARWKAAIERDTYSGPPKSQKRMYG